MKCKPAQLTARLSKGVPTCSLVSGEDQFLVQESVGRIRAAARKSGCTEHFHRAISTPEELGEVLDETSTGSLFASQRLCEVHLLAVPPGQVFARQLLKLAQHGSHASPMLLVLAKKLDRAAQAKEWIKHVDAHGLWVETWPLSEQEHITWLEQALGRRNLDIDNEALQTLFELTCGNLVIARQEVHKLTLLFPTKHHRLSRDDILSAIADNARFKLLEVVDQALLGNCERVAHGWKQLRHSGEDPAQLCATLYFQLNQLLQLCIAMDNRCDRRTEARRLGVFASKLHIFETAMKRLKTRQVTRLLRYCAALDTLVKGVRKGNTNQAAIALLLTIAGKNTPSLNLLMPRARD